MTIVGDKVISRICLCYYPDENLFRDSYGHVIFSFFRLVPVWKVQLFKINKVTEEYINYKYGIIVKLLYPIKKENENE